MAGIKKKKTDAQKAKFYSNTVKRTGKWRGKKADEYIKYTRRKREEEKDWFFHAFLGYTLRNPRKYYSKKEMIIRNKRIMNKKGGYEVLKRLKQL